MIGGRSIMLIANNNNHHRSCSGDSRVFVFKVLLMGKLQKV